MLNKELLIHKLNTSEKWVTRAVIAIYNNQTLVERQAKKTFQNDSRGYNSFDVELMTTYAKRFISGQKLSPNELGLARHKVKKYTRQLLQLAEDKKK